MNALIDQRNRLMDEIDDCRLEQAVIESQRDALAAALREIAITGAKMPKLTYDEALEMLANERTVTRDMVSARALRRKIWVSGNGSPGCLYDNGPNYSRTKADAIACCAFTADWCDDAPNPYAGIVSALRRYHSFAAKTGERFEISQTTLGDVL